MKDIKTFVHDAPENIQRGVSTVKNEFSALGSLPDTFPCAHCSSVLSTPRGPWVCQVNDCEQHNEESASNCARCSVYRYSLGVLCGICGRSTPIPRNKLQADANIMAARASNSAAKNAAYATNKPYIECPHCAGVVHPPAAQLASVLRIPAPATVEGPDGTVVTGNELQLDFYQPADLPGPPAEVTCGNCLRKVTYSAPEVHCYALDSKRRAMRNAESAARAQAAETMPAREVIPETECFSCKSSFGTLHRRIICARCSHTFCSSHAPYMRQIHPGQYGLSGKATFCIKCATEYDIENGSDVHPAPLAAGNGDVDPFNGNQIPHPHDNTQESTLASAPSAADVSIADTPHSPMLNNNADSSE